MHILTNLGEEYFIKNGLDSGASTWRVGLYDDASTGSSGDSITETSDLPVSSEPGDGNYQRQTSAFSPEDLSGDWGSDSDSKLTFDVTNTTGTVDSWFLIISFQASDTGDGSSTDHLIATGGLSQEYSLSNVDTLEISAGGVGVTVT